MDCQIKHALVGMATRTAYLIDLRTCLQSLSHAELQNYFTSGRADGMGRKGTC